MPEYIQDIMIQAEDYYENQADGSFTSRDNTKLRPQSYGKLRDPRVKTKTPGNSSKDKY